MPKTIEEARSDAQEKSWISGQSDYDKAKSYMRIRKGMMPLFENKERDQSLAISDAVPRGPEHYGHEPEKGE